MKEKELMELLERRAKGQEIELKNLSKKMNEFVSFCTDTRMVTCERKKCELNDYGKCLLRRMMINSQGQCGWYIPKEAEISKSS